MREKFDDWDVAVLCRASSRDIAPATRLLRRAYASRAVAASGIHLAVAAFGLLSVGATETEHPKLARRREK